MEDTLKGAGWLLIVGAIIATILLSVRIGQYEIEISEEEDEVVLSKLNKGFSVLKVGRAISLTVGGAVSAALSIFSDYPAMRWVLIILAAAGLGIGLGILILSVFLFEFLVTLYFSYSFQLFFPISFSNSTITSYSWSTRFTLLYFISLNF